MSPPLEPNEACDMERGCSHDCSPGSDYHATDWRGDPITWIWEHDVSHGDYTAAELSACDCEHHL
jgi:hypothetical protein